MAKETRIESLSYEQAFQEIEDIVNRLEGEMGNLDEAIRLFERGQALAKHCATLLEGAELKVKQIDDDGEMTDIEMDSDS